MARVYLGTLGAGVLQNTNGDVQAGQSVTIKNRDGTNATHYSARTGGSSSTAAITTSSTGTIERWVNAGSYRVTVGANTYDFEAPDGNTVGLTADPATGVAATDGAHLQDLIDTLAANGGGPVNLQDNQVYVGNVTLKAGVLLTIPTSTTLRGAAGVTSPVVDGLNFATLTGKTKATGDYLLGARGAGVVGGGTVDGNTIAANCVRLWGADLHLECRTIKATSHGIFTEFTDVDSFLDETQHLEGTFGAVISHGNGGDGWRHRGPHDSVCESYTCWDNTGWGITVDAVASSYNGGITFGHFNSYLNTAGSARVLNTGFIDIKSGALSGEGGTGLELSTTSGACRARAAVAGHEKGIHLRGVSHKIEITAATNNGFASANGDVVYIEDAGWCEVNIGGGNTNDNVIRFISEVGPNYLHGVIDIGAATFMIGTPTSSQTRIDFNGQTMYLGSNTFHAPNGWNPVLPASNGTMMTGDLATFTAQAAAGVPNNSLFRDSADGKLKYKDNGGTVNALY
jgi:hypothetical protein